nr:MAG TPA: hypothetical protein [Caudoviricetes sp.]
MTKSTCHFFDFLYIIYIFILFYFNIKQVTN